MSANIQIQINQLCEAINKRIKQMTYNEESHIREFLEQFEFDNDTLTIIYDDCDYIAGVLNVNETSIYDVARDIIGIDNDDIDNEYDEDDERFWKEQDRADDYNDERRLGI